MHSGHSLHEPYRTLAAAQAGPANGGTLETAAWTATASASAGTEFYDGPGECAAMPSNNRHQGVKTRWIR